MIRELLYRVRLNKLFALIKINQCIKEIKEMIALNYINKTIAHFMCVYWIEGQKAIPQQVETTIRRNNKAMLKNAFAMSVWASIK